MNRMPPPPLKLGGLSVSPPVVLAPMAGYTDTALRSLCREYGCGMVMTEVVNAEAIVHGSRRTMHLLETGPGERPVGAHIYGSEPSVMAEAAATIEKLGRFDFVDINAGCPVRKIVARGGGVALMARPEAIKEIVAAVRQAVSLPVTVKTRLGLSADRANISEVAQAVEEGGAAAVMIHARLASDKHSGPADWEALARVKRERSIPVVGNGGIEKAEDAVAMLARTGVDAAMIGRAAVGNPWIFRDAARLCEGNPSVPHSLQEHREVILEHFRRVLALKRKEHEFRRRPGRDVEEAAVLHFRPHLHRFLSGFRSAAVVRRRLNTLRSMADLRDVIDGAIEDEAALGCS